MENNCRLIGLVLMSTILIFGPACDVASAGPFPTATEQGYPESLNLVKSSIEDFAKGGSPVKPGIFSPNDLKRSTKFDSSLSDLTGVSLFDDPDDDESFQGVVAINTDRGNTVTGQGQFHSIPTDVNYMDIDVRNIIVISINTARGGNAIATSEIFIEPTQRAS
jgi:hypothetical protein